MDFHTSDTSGLMKQTVQVSESK